MSAAKIIKWTAGFALVCLTLEFCARLDDWWVQGADPLKPYTINTLFKASDLGREGVPNAKFGKWHINSMGYRGPEPQPDRTNILTFGASETFGLYESAGKEYPRQLESKLNEDQARFNVVNIALPGIRIGRVSYLTAAIQKTQPKYVIIYPSPANYIGADQPFCHKEPVPVPPEKGIGDTIRLYGKVEQLSKSILPDWVMTPMRQFATWRATRHLTVQKQVPDATLAALAKDMACVANAVSAAGAKPIFVTHANYFGPRIQPEAKAMAIAWRRFYPELTEEALVGLDAQANEVIRRVGATLSVTVVDAASHIEPGPEHFADFVHFNDKGAKKMAELLALSIQ